MPRVQPDIANAVAGIPLLKKDDYEFIIGAPKGFFNESTDEKGNPTQNYGVRYSVRVATLGEYKDKSIPISCFFHTNGSRDMTLRFLMSALGFDPRNQSAEAEFKAQYAEDWWIDTSEDPPTYGEVFKKAEGARIAATATIVPNKRTGEMQNFFNWRPI